MSIDCWDAEQAHDHVLLMANTRPRLNEAKNPRVATSP
jgi:hypothetical protein